MSVYDICMYICARLSLGYICMCMYMCACVYGVCVYVCVSDSSSFSKAFFTFSPSSAIFVCLLFVFALSLYFSIFQNKLDCFYLVQ